jgi:DNA-binding NarL/FixJ family response regulator
MNAEPGRARRVRVVVADDHQDMLSVLVQMLSPQYEVVAAVGDGRAAVAAAERLAPDLLILDISMPELDGIAAAVELKGRGSAAKVVFITMYDDREFVRASSTLGAIGFVVKNRLASDLLPAVRTVLAGQTFVSASIVV